MILLLIDTCTIIRDFISKVEYSQFLKQLTIWVENNDIKVICPEPLKEEWEKHKTEEELKIEKTIKNQQKKADLFQFIIPQSKMNYATERLKSQINAIDKILSNSIYIPISDNAKIKTTDNRRFRKAPFRNKRDSDNDALIFFSSMDYLKENKINELYFISSNYTDFACKPSDTTVHPDLLEGYNDIQVHYNVSTERAFEDLIMLKGLEKSETKILDKEKVIQIFSIDKSKPILDQLFDLIKLCYKEINNLPIHLLINKYPLKKQNSYYSVFSLQTDNDELSELFESIQIDGNKINFSNLRFIQEVDNYEEKTKEILLRLNKNLIFNIVNQEKGISINISYNDETICNCISCSYFRLKFNSVLEEFNLQSSSVNDLLKIAYINYQMGKYYEAAKLLLEIVDKTKDNGFDLIHFRYRIKLS